jgi:hypothetical protein
VRTLISIVAVVCVMAGVGLAYAAQSAGAHSCMDDQACWNWRTMGNHKRAITTNGGRTLVVGPARFDRANRGFYIDWARTPALKGDGPRLNVQNY